MKKVFFILALLTQFIVPSFGQASQYEVSNPFINSYGDFSQTYSLPTGTTSKQVFPFYTITDTVFTANTQTDTFTQKIGGHNHSLTIKTHFTWIAGAYASPVLTIYANADSSSYLDYFPFEPTYTVSWAATPHSVKSQLTGDWDVIHTYSLTTATNQHDTYILNTPDNYTNIMLVLTGVTHTGSEVSWWSGLNIK